MEKEFYRYVDKVVPELFKMASLKPSLQVAETGEDILHYLTETENATGEKGVSVQSDEIEEKNIGIQMMCVIVDELEELYADYIEETSNLFLSLLDFRYNVSIREAVADTLGTMLKAAKAKFTPEETLAYAQRYITALFQTMGKESDVNVMQHQVHGIKQCIDVMGEFLNEHQVNQMKDILFTAIHKSDTRKHMNFKYTEENEQSDDEVDKQNREFMEEENEMEDDLQLSISDAFGALFKTHKNHCSELLKDLFTEKLPEYLNEEAAIVKQKFALYIVVDLVEHLGLEILGEKYQDCFEVIAKYSQHINPILRQASVYGLGMSAKQGGEYFKTYSQDTIDRLKFVIDMEIGSQEKIEFLH